MMGMQDAGRGGASVLRVPARRSCPPDHLLRRIDRFLDLAGADIEADRLIQTCLIDEVRQALSDVTTTCSLTRSAPVRKTSTSSAKPSIGVIPPIAMPNAGRVLVVVSCGGTAPPGAPYAKDRLPTLQQAQSNRQCEKRRGQPSSVRVSEKNHRQGRQGARCGE